MKLDDFLKVNTVRCVKAYDDCLEIGKEYGVIDIRMEVKVKDDEGDNYYWESDHFEPVLDSAENPLQEIELTPEFETETSEPKFKVDNKVYKYGETDVKTVLEVFEDGYMRISNYPYRVNHEVICHATPENHAMLSKPYPHIKFEQPPKPMTGIELAKKLIAKGHNYLVVDTVIGIRVLTRLEGNTLIDSNNVRLDELDDITPLDDITGEPLTQAVLDE